MAERDTGVSGRAWTRTKSQWVRSVAVCGAVAVSVSVGVLGFLAFLARTAVGFVGEYLAGGAPDVSVRGAVIGGACLGLGITAAWGWLGRPRLLAGSASRTGGDTTGARVWTGLPDPDDNGSAGPAVTS